MKNWKSHVPVTRPRSLNWRPGLVNQWSPGAVLTCARLTCSRGGRARGFTRCCENIFDVDGSVLWSGGSMGAADEQPGRLAAAG